MALPKLNDSPKYDLVIPSTKQKVKFRPYLVKEEKVLMLASESGDNNQALQAIVDTIKACVSDDINTSELTTFDVEYAFTQIRSKSVGETSTVGVKCNHCQTQNEVSIPLDDIKVVKTRGHKKELKLDDEIAVTMGYPNLESFVESNFGEDTNQIEQIFEMAAGCIETIADTNQIYECKDLPKSEILEFLDQLSSKQFGELQKFFETMPKLSHKVQVTNPNTGVESEVVLEGLASFFA